VYLGKLPGEEPKARTRGDVATDGEDEEDEDRKGDEEKVRDGTDGELPLASCSYPNGRMTFPR
jgi:hypothetical protein